MDELQLIISNLLQDQNIDDFEDSLLFKEQVMQNPDAIRILLQLLRKSTGESHERIALMIASVAPAMLPEVARGFEVGDSNWHHRLMEIIWTIVNLEKSRDWQTIFDTIKSPLSKLFTDTRSIEPEYENPIEIEHTLRVCDDAYLLCKGLLEPEFIPSDFLDLEFQERDFDIRTFRSQIDGDLLV